MTVIRHNSISGIVSITAAAGSNLAFYDSTGSTLSLDTGDINAGVITATTANFTNATISGDLTVNGTTTTLDTTLTEVDKLEVGANNTTVGVAITQSGSGDILRLYDGATQVVTVKDGGSVLMGSATDIIGSNRLLVQSASTSNNNRTFSVYNTSASSTTAFENRIAQLSSLGNGADVTLHFSDQTAYNAYIGMGSGDLYFATNGTNERLRIDSSGNYRFRTGSGGTLTLGIANGVGTQIQRLLYDDSDGSLSIGGGTATGYPLKFFTGNDERLRILSGGDIQVKTDGGRIYGSGTFTVFSGSTSGRLDLFGGSTNRGGEIELYGGSNNDGIIVFRSGAGSGIQPERLRITSGGNVQIDNGNLVFSTSGTGIDFSATADGSGTTTSELLDDYEEGNFTPVLSATSVNVTYTAQQGHYTKIGRTVFFTIQLNLSIVTSVGTGDFTIGGLPFSGSTGSFRYVIQTSNVNFDATRYSHYVYKPLATTLGVLYTNDNASWSVAQATDFAVNNGAAITVTGFYKI